MKALILAAIRCSLMFAAVTASLFSIRPAQAYTVTLKQIASNVVATGSGAINLTGLTFFLPGIDCHSEDLGRWWGYNATGPPGGSGDVDLYTWIHRTDEFRERVLVLSQHWQRRHSRH